MRIIIIGNGIAGTNAARFIRKLSDHSIVMISDETLVPFSRTALMYVYMGHLKQENTALYEDWFWEKNRIQRVHSRAMAVDLKDKRVQLQDGKFLDFDKLIIATGSKPNRFGWPGQDLDGVGGLYHLQDLANMERFSPKLNRAVVVGGGLIGIEMAEMFHSRHIPVTYLVRESSFWNGVLPKEESQMVNRHLREYGIDLRLETELKEIIGDASGKVAAVRTNTGETIDCGFVGLAVGVSPNIAFLEHSGLELDRGVVVDEFLTTSHPDVFAIGDCAQLRQPRPGRKAIEAIWYTGRSMGQTVAKTVCQGPTPYVQAPWFNSAKFFDIEYQVYGDIPAKIPEQVTSLFWEHPSGKKSLRINFEKATGAVLGFNIMGIRYRQAVCEKWISERTPIETVLKNLPLANFDPEFSTLYEKELIGKYNSLTNSTLSVVSPRRLDWVRAFLKNESHENNR